MQALAQQLLSKNQIPFSEITLHPFQDKVMEKTYDVYLVDTGTAQYVMKSGKREFENYWRWFGDNEHPVPRVLSHSIPVDDQFWFLMEYLPGQDLRGADANTVLKTAAQLAELHSRFWIQSPEPMEDDHYSSYYWRFIPRFPEVPSLQDAIRLLISRMESCPRTLIHDDLLPINVQVTDNGIRFLDWHYCGMYPYFMDICRLLVHDAGELGSSFPPEIRAAAFERYYDTLIASGCTDLSIETYRNDIRLGTIAELVSCLQQEDRSQWKSFLWNYYKTVVELST